MFYFTPTGEEWEKYLSLGIFYIDGIDIGKINNALLNHGIMYGDIYKVNCIATELYNYGLMKLIL